MIEKKDLEKQITSNTPKNIVTDKCNKCNRYPDVTSVTDIQM